MELEDNIKKIINENKYKSIKFLDKTSYFEAPSLALDGLSFSKPDKPVLLIGSEAIFDYMHISREMFGKSKERYSGNLEELSRLRSQLDYSDGFSKLSSKKGFLTMRDSENQRIRNEVDYSNYIFKTFKNILKITKNLDIETELIASDFNLLAKLKNNELPADSWNDIGLHSLTQLYFGWSEITTKKPNFSTDYEKQVLHGRINYATGNNANILREIVEKLKNEHYLNAEDVSDFHPQKFRPNEILFIENFDGNYNLRYDAKQNRLINFNSQQKMSEIWHQSSNNTFHGIKPRNKWQQAQMELMMSGTNLLVFFGAAGSGKTLLPLAFGAHALKEKLNSKKGEYDEIVKKIIPNYSKETSPNRIVPSTLIDSVNIYRPTGTLDEEGLGFLPGELNEKMGPLVEPIYKNLSLIMSRGSKATATDKEKIDKFTEKFNVQPVFYLRGASFHNQLTILDEAQNVKDETIKTVLTRMTGSSKIIFTGDPTQDDVSTGKAQSAIYYNSLTRFIKKYCGPDMPEFMGVLFMPPQANERGEISRYFL